jgi:hypothetical protein
MLVQFNAFILSPVKTVGKKLDDLARVYYNYEVSPISFKLSMFLTQIC